MKPEIRIKMKRAIIAFILEDTTDFELVWVYHHIFHERQSLTADLPDCDKCTALNA